MKEYTASKKELAEIDRVTAQALVDYINGDCTDVVDLMAKKGAKNVSHKSTAKS